MERVEQRELIRTINWAARTYGPGHRFSVEDLCALHRHWLGGIYEWAGTYRQVNVSKGGFLFAASGLIPSLMVQFESECLAKYTPLRKDYDDIWLALAETHAEFLLIHPFRDGNGRIARLLSTSMAWQAGLATPEFEVMLKSRTPEYFAAVRAGLNRDYEPMRRIFISMVDGGAA